MFVIEEVNRLEKLDKNMRKMLASSSMDFNSEEKNVENIYERCNSCKSSLPGSTQLTRSDMC